MTDSVLASQAYIGICSERTLMTTGLSRQCRKTISCDKAVDSKPVQNVVLFTFANPGPNARPVTVEPNLILFGSAVALQLKIAFLKTQERLQSSYVQFKFFDTQQHGFWTRNQNQNWSQVEPRPLETQKRSIMVVSNSLGSMRQLLGVNTSAETKHD